MPTVVASAEPVTFVEVEVEGTGEEAEEGSSAPASGSAKTMVWTRLKALLQTANEGEAGDEDRSVNEAWRNQSV